MVNDSLSDFIIRLKNASMSRRQAVSVPFSKMKQAVADVLVKEGYLISSEKKGKKIRKYLDVVIRYDENGKSHINGVKRISKLGKRVYVRSQNIKPVKFGHGVMVISTSKGLKTDKEAKAEKLGGEALFSIW